MELSSSYVLSDCNAVDAGYQCLSTCDSVWFKIDNKTEADYYVKYCDPIFQVKYGDITWDLLKRVKNRKHNCTGFHWLPEYQQCIGVNDDHEVSP